MSFATNINLHGKGEFTTIAVFDGTIFLWEKHWRRLTTNANHLGIDIAAYSQESVFALLEEAVRVAGITKGRARITILDHSPSPIWSDSREQKTEVSIVTAAFRKVPENFRLTASPYLTNSLSPLAGVKSCNYLEKILTLSEAKSRGFDEAILVNERGEITSAAMANVFWLKDGQLFTPSLKTGCLAGTTREFVLENLECREAEAGQSELETADAIFLTSAGLGVTQVAEFESKVFQKTRHPIIDLLPTHN
ncbi:MAG: aminotransferase class IV [Pyrinomonadaceae bacterium]